MLCARSSSKQRGSARAVAGSKLLRSDDPERLLAIGIATDVFVEPYLGIDEDEIDHGQYDVVRDVAAVSGASLLIRRDLVRGLGGPDPAMAPGAAAIDICQRARLRGARVVVVPSSEVAFPADRLAPETWREEAGRIRAMIKVYSLLTLVWALPVRFLIGLIDAFVAPPSRPLVCLPARPCLGLGRCDLACNPRGAPRRTRGTDCERR